MTDKNALLNYRMSQAQETLNDAKTMLAANVGTRSVVNRAYYATFYMTLAFFLKNDVNLLTSKHTGVIAVFDKEFVHSGKVDKKYSKILHKLFEARQHGDYKELVKISFEETTAFVEQAQEFFDHMQRMMV